MLPLILNAVTATLGPSGVANGSVTSWTLVSGHGARFGTIPNGYYVPVVVVTPATASPAPEVIWEYAYVTGVSGDVLTVLRAQEDAARFPAGPLAGGLIVAAVATAGFLAQVTAPTNLLRSLVQ